MNGNIRTGLAFLALTGGLFAQALIEHAVVVGPAAVGGVAGAAIGSKLGQALDSAAGTVQAASKADPKQKAAAPAAGKTEVKQLGAYGAESSGSGSSGRASRGPASTAVAQSGVVKNGGPIPEVASPEATPAVAAAPATPPPAPALTKEELLSGMAGMQPGLARGEVLAKLGAPASRISFDEDGAMMERCRFRAAGEDVVLLEFKNGVLSSIKSLVR